MLCGAPDACEFGPRRAVCLHVVFFADNQKLSRTLKRQPTGPGLAMSNRSHAALSSDANTGAPARWQFLEDLSGAGGGSGTKRRQPEDADAHASPFRDYTSPCQKRHGLLARTLFDADQETASTQRFAAGSSCTAKDAVAGQLSPRSQDMTPSRPPSVVPYSLFPGVQCRTPGPPEERRAIGLPHQRPSQLPTHVAPNVGTAGSLPGACGGKAITPPYDPICLGFFAKKSPSPQRSLAKTVFPKCLSPVLPPRPSRATLRQDYVRQEKQELMEMFMAAQEDGSIILTRALHEAPVAVHAHTASIQTPNFLESSVRTEIQ